jgi:hypothetical protein
LPVISAAIFPSGTFNRFTHGIESADLGSTLEQKKRVARRKDATEIKIERAEGGGGN